MSRVITQDRGLKKLIEHFEEAGNTKGFSGFFSDGKGGRMHPRAKMPIYKLVVIHEKGAPRAKPPIPRRAPVERSITEIQEPIQNMMIEGIRNIGSKRFPETMKNVVRIGAKKIESNIKNPAKLDPRNAEVTVRNKGFDNPLFDHGDMAKAAEGRVVVG